MVLHVEALFGHDAAGRLVGVNEPGGGAAPRFFLGRTAAGAICRSRFDVPDQLRLALETIMRNRISPKAAWDGPLDPTPFRLALENAEPIQHIWAGPAFSFPPNLPVNAEAQSVSADNLELLHPHFAGWVADVVAGCPLAATVVDGVAVSVCCSVRQTAKAHEAGVETASAFRGRGFAVAAVAAWARTVRERGIVPLYSASWDNSASRAVAHKLNLVHFGSDLHLT